MNKKILFFWILIAASLKIEAQITATVGNGTNIVAYPFFTYYMDAKTEMLYTVSDLQGAGALPGTITRIGFDVVDRSLQPMSNFKIKMQVTNLNNLSGFTLTGWTTVYAATYTVPATGWQMIDLQVPFVWDGVSNLLVQVYYDNNTFNLNSTVNATTITGKVWQRRSDYPSGNIEDSLGGTTQVNRPNTRFHLIHTVSLSCGNAFKGTIEPDVFWQWASFDAGTKPYWRFRAEAGLQYDFGLCAYGDSTILRIYDTTGQLLDSAGSNGPICPGPPASMSWICNTTGYYYISASHPLCFNMANGDALEYRKKIRDCDACEPANTALGNIGTLVWGYHVKGNCLVGGKWAASFEGQAGRTYHFDLCPDPPGNGYASPATDFDIKIADQNCNILSGEDGNCISLSYVPNDFQWVCPTNGTYYVILAPYPSYNAHHCSGTVNDTFNLNYYKEPIELTCPTGSVQEGETVCSDGYVDTFNGGCDSSPAAFSDISSICGETICGKAGVFDSGTSKDEDWYRFVLTDSANIYIECIAEFDLFIGLKDGTGGCPGSPFLSTATADEGQTASITFVAGPGTWWLLVTPSNYNDWTCSGDYILEFATIAMPPLPQAMNNPSCGPTDLLPIPSFGSDRYYWQGTSCGTSTTSPATAPYPVTTSGTYYVRTHNSGSGCWSDICASIAVLILTPPAEPMASDITTCISFSDTLYATGSTGNYFWWDETTQNKLGAGSPFITPVLDSTTHFYVTAWEPHSFGKGVKITDIYLGSIDSLEIQNTGYEAVDVNGWIVATSNDFSDINEFNPTHWHLNGIMAPEEVQWRCDTSTSPNYWGANLHWNTGQPGWAIIIDDIGNVQDFVAWGWTTPALYTLNTTINNFSVIVNYIWSGGSVAASNPYITRVHSDDDVATDWLNLTTGSIGYANVMSYSTGDTCLSDPVLVIAHVVLPADQPGIITGDSLVCVGFSGIPYSIPPVNGAVSYSWNYTGTGATIYGDTNSIWVSFSGSATSGDLVVAGVNVCGAGQSQSFPIFVDACVGVAENNGALHFNIYPNPGDGVFNIEFFSRTSALYAVDIFDIQGRLIAEESFSAGAGTNSISIRLKDQPPGSYFVRLTDGNETAGRIIIINR